MGVCVCVGQILVLTGLLRGGGHEGLGGTMHFKSIGGGGLAHAAPPLFLRLCTCTQFQNKGKLKMLY